MLSEVEAFLLDKNWAEVPSTEFYSKENEYPFLVIN